MSLLALLNRPERIAQIVKRIVIILVAGLVLAGLVPATAGVAAKSQVQRQGATPAAITVLVGLGQTGVSPGSQLAFTPKYVDISVGDTVKFREIDKLEPHTVTFGSMATLKKMSDNLITPMPQKNGPPLLVIDPKGVAPTSGSTYAGTGIANSGILPVGKSWSLTFTTPGTYHYICLIHGTGMAGVVTVHPAQTGHTWMVQAGDGMAAINDKMNTTTNDSFYPRHLSIKVGDTVQWIGGFHTISFGPESMLHQLEQNLFIPMSPQGGGAPKLVFNPKIAFPSGGSSYSGTGFTSSGILPFQVPPGSKAPPMYKLTFTTPGTFTYDCLIHPGMDGTITVTP
jgi:plastocyanin